MQKYDQRNYRGNSYVSNFCEKQRLQLWKESLE